MNIIETAILELYQLMKPMITFLNTSSDDHIKQFINNNPDISLDTTKKLSILQMKKVLSKNHQDYFYLYMAFKYCQTPKIKLDLPVPEPPKELIIEI